MTDRELAGCALSEVMALLEKATPGELMYVPDYGWNIASDTFSPKSRTAGSVGTAIRPQDAQAICASVNFLRQHGLALLAALSTPSSEGDGRDGERYRWLRDLPDGSPYECIGNMPGDRWDDEIDAARERERSSDICPNCVSPWKCNGPHIGDAPANEYEDVR